MRTPVFPLAGAVIALLLSSCGPRARSSDSFDEIRAAISGKRAAEIEAQLGPPDHREPMAGPGELWVWWNYTILDGPAYPPEVRGEVVHLQAVVERGSGKVIDVIYLTRRKQVSEASAARSFEPLRPPLPLPPPPPTAPAPLEVSLKFTRECWVDALVDAKTRRSEMRVGGEVMHLQAQESIVFDLGDAGAVEIRVNGHPMPLRAKDGEIKRITIDRETARELRDQAHL